MMPCMIFKLPCIIFKVQCFCIGGILSALEFHRLATHDCASILDSIAKRTSCFHHYSHGASLHHCSFSRVVFTLVLSDSTYMLL